MHQRGEGVEELIEHGRAVLQLSALQMPDGDGQTLARLLGVRTGSAPVHPVSASRSFFVSRSVSLFSWPQAAKMSRPRGVRTGLA